MSLTAFLSRYTAPVAALVREFNSTAGHWVTAGGDEDGDGGGVHLFISGSGGSKGIVTKGPKSLIGASLNNLSNGPHSIKHHPVDHTPPGAKEYPSYAEHKPTPTAPVTKQEGQQEGVKSSGKPYARLHGADQGIGAGAAEKGTAGASASAEGVHSAQEGPEPLTKEQAEAGLVKARAESTAQAAPGSPGDADPRDIAATAEFEKHKQQLLHDHPDLKAHIDADTHHAGEAERWVNNEARTRLAPEHKARGSVTRNAQPYAKPQLPDAGATKAADERKATDDKEAVQAGTRRMTEAAVTRGKAMNDPQRADVTRVHAKQAAHSRKPAYDTPRVSDDERDARASSVEGAAWEDRTKALVAQHSGKTPDEMRYVAGNLESQHAPDAKERMAKAGIVPSHPQRVLEEAARRLRQMADDKDAPTAAEKPQDAPKAEAKGDNPKDDFAAKTRAAMAATAAHGPTDYAARDAGRAATHKPRPVTDLASVTKTAPYVAPASGAADAPAKGSDHGRIVKDAQGTHYRIDHPDDIVAHQKQAALGREFRAKNPNTSKQLMEQAASYDPAKHHVMQSFDKKGNPDRMFHVDRSDPKLAETTPVEGKAVPLSIRKHQEYEDALAAAGDDPDARAKAAVRMWQHYEPLPTAARGIEKVDKPDLEQEGRLNNAAQIAKLGERYPQMADPNHPVHEDIQRTTRTFGQRNALIGRQQALGELRNKIEDAGIKVGAHQEEHPLHDEHEAALSQIQARIDHYKGRSEALKDTAEREAAPVPEIVKKHLTPGQRKEREASVKLRARYSAPTSMAAR